MAYHGIGQSNRIDRTRELFYENLQSCAAHFLCELKQAQQRQLTHVHDAYAGRATGRVSANTLAVHGAMIRLRTQTNGSLEAVRQPGDLRGIANTSMHREQQVVCMRLEIESGY